MSAPSDEDAVYPTALTDADGQPFDSSQRFLLHFGPGQTPPAEAFWSLTMYDGQELFTASAINRFAIGDRDAPTFNGDGSLDIHMCREPPGADLESNWLPGPASGPFTMNLRLYWPKPGALDGTRQPPQCDGTRQPPAVRRHAAAPRGAAAKLALAARLRSTRNAGPICFTPGG